MASLLELLRPFVSGLQSFTGLNANQLTGGGLLLGSALTGQEPGSVTEARQFLRNRFTSPLALSEQFGTQIKGLSDQFQPLLTQQRERGLSDIQQRFVKAFPASVGAQPREFTALGRYLTEQALPQEQGLLGNLGLNLLGAQERAATTLLGEHAQNQLAQALGLVGGSLLSRDGTTNIAIGGQGGAGGGTTLFDQAGRPIGRVSQDGSLIPVGTTTGLPGLTPSGQIQPNQVEQLAQLLMTEQGQTQLAQRFGPEIASRLLPHGPGGPVAVDVLSQMIAAPGQSFLFTSPTGATAIVSPGEAALLQAQGVGTISPVTGAGASGASALLNALGVVGTAGAGFGIGQLGSRIGQNQVQSSLLGAGGGAASGALLGSTIFPGVGTAIGAIVGGLSGLLGGLFGERSQQQAIKAQFRSQDVDSQRDQVFEIGNIGATFLQRFGIDQAGMDAWASRVNTLAANVESPEAEQQLLAAELGVQLTRLLGGPPAVKAPALRQEFIDYLVTNTFTAGNSKYSGGPPLNLIDRSLDPSLSGPTFVELAGLKHGGLTTRRVQLVGESGPELLISKPGTALVVPLLSGRN